MVKAEPLAVKDEDAIIPHRTAYTGGRGLGGCQRGCAGDNATFNEEAREACVLYAEQYGPYERYGRGRGRGGGLHFGFTFSVHACAAGEQA